MNRTGHRTSHLFPEESPGQDRITEQLMFLPPAGEMPSNQEDASLPLKKILMWNGVSSWGGVRPGRGEFIKQECPVSTCAIVTNRDQAENVDMVLFKDHFNLPTFKRPQSQIWTIFMLGKMFFLYNSVSDVFNSSFKNDENGPLNICQSGLFQITKVNRKVNSNLLGDEA